MPATSLTTEELQSVFEPLNAAQAAVGDPDRQERLARIGEMTARFAHQVRTPLASAMLYTAQLDRDTPEQRRATAKITARLNDIGRMVNDMLGFAAGTRRSRELVRVHELLTTVRLAIEAQLTATTDLQVAVDDVTLQIAANRDALKGALLNLVINAAQACDEPAKVVLSATREDDAVAISVTDNGPGIAPADLPHLFEPFFTTRPQGTGLGLAVVLAVAKVHNGDVNVDTSRNGTRFTLRLPTGPTRERLSG